jgi:hypothetical protein
VKNVLVLLSALVLAACGHIDDRPDPEPTPVPVRGSIGYQLLDGVERLDAPKSGVARMFSSHNRNPASNIDYNQYLRRDGDTYTMVEHNGPGVLTRLWMTARIGTSLANSRPGFSAGAVLSVYVDGSAQPLFAIDPNLFFAGTLYPFVFPLVGQHQNPTGPDGKGFYSYVPISFASSLRITLTRPFPPGAPYPTERVFYHANILELTGQGAVEPSPVRRADGTLALSAEDAELHAELAAAWNDPAAYAARMERAASRTSFPGPVTGTTLVAELPGPGRIRGLRLRTGNLSPEALERLSLRIRWDGEAAASVDMPLGTAWGSHFSRARFASVVQGALADGTLYLYLPMPFRSSARIELLHSGAGAAAVSAEIFHDRGPVPRDARYLHAAFVGRAVQAPARLLLAEASGAGHLIGTQLVVNVRSDPHALEGDEFITADGQTLYKGTGTEDYFNAHWFFEGGLRTHALHGTTSVGPRIRPDVHTHRFMVPDLVPFARSLRFELENGNVPGNTDDYRAVTFYYLSR